MAEAVVAAVAEAVVAAACYTLIPFTHFNLIVQDFKMEQFKLLDKMDDVRYDVYETLRQAEEIEKDFEKWLTAAEPAWVEAERLKYEIKRSKWCNRRRRSSLSKKVVIQTLYISKLVETCDLIQDTLPNLETEFMPSNCSTYAFKEIMEALIDHDVGMIGLLAMGGMGKTTLAKEVEVHIRQFFNEVVFVTVTQTPNIDHIQDQVAEMLHSNLQKTTTERRAKQLRSGIKGVKSILVILDDVWEELDLKAIGIPFGDDHKGCKILLTTRSQQVCTEMGCSNVVQLNELSEHEAWALFKYTADLEGASPTLIDLAKEVSRKCKRLPLAIVVVAKALKGNSLDEWITAHQLLMEGTSDQKSYLNPIYDSIEDNMKECFLLCSLFPADCNINIELLTICGIGLGLFIDINLIEDLRREIRQAVTKLQKFGLLQETNDKEFVKMPDIVRDFAHERGENMFMVKDELIEWPEIESFGCYTAISLWNSKINTIPGNFEFSKLKTLFLTAKDSLKVPMTFFQGMKTLRVLYLKHVVFSVEALQFLTNLRTLCCIDCELKNISSLRSLDTLEVLALFNTNIHELPELVQLRRLKLLYFPCIEPGNFSLNLLSRLVSLQELHWISENNANILELNSLSCLTGLTLRVSCGQYFEENCVFPKLQSYDIVVDFENMEGLTSGIRELFCNAKRLTLANINMKGENNFSPCLAQNLLHVGQLKISTYGKFGQVLAFDKETAELEENQAALLSNLTCLRLSSLPTLESIWKELTRHVSLQSLEVVTVQNCDGLKSIFSPYLAQSLSHLEQLEISNCDELEQVFAFAQEIAERVENQAALLPSLACLKLSSLLALRSIWEEPTHHASLQSPKEVIVRECDALKSIVPPCIAQSLFHLKQLEISQCSKLVQVFAFSEEMSKQEVPPLSNLVHLELKTLPELRWIWTGATDRVSLQGLKIIRIHCCFKLEYLFSPALAQTLENLEELVVEDCNSLKHLITEAENIDGSNMAPDLRWLKLKRLRVARCKSLKYVFPITLAQGLLHLESLQIIECPILMHVFHMENKMDGQEAKKMDRPHIVLRELQVLKLENLKWLRSFCPKNYYVELSPSLDLRRNPNLC